VVAVVGSPRRGNTATLVAAAVAELEARGAACETISLSDLTVAPCLAHDGCGDLRACLLRDDGATVMDRVYAADCLILGSPVYYENVSAQMKAFIDRNVFRYAHGEWLRAKAVGLVAVTAETGLEETLAPLPRYVALSTDAAVPVSTCAGYADEAGAAAADEGLLAEDRPHGSELADALGLSRA
jgi:multimeric flavodoxin WrbA